MTAVDRSVNITRMARETKQSRVPTKALQDTASVVLRDGIRVSDQELIGTALEFARKRRSYFLPFLRKAISDNARAMAREKTGQ